MSQRELLQRSLEALEVDGNRDFIGLRQQIKYELEKPEPIHCGLYEIANQTAHNINVDDGIYELTAVRYAK